MAGDYRVTYRTKEVDHDPERFEVARARIPTALDPYRYPDDRDQLKRAVAETNARTARYRDDYREYDSPSRRDITIRDDVSISTAKESVRPAATKTTYSVTESGLEKESEVMVRAPTVVSNRDGASLSRQTTRRDDEFQASRAATRISSRPYDDCEYYRADRVYDVERPRRDERPYVVDCRDADRVEIISADRYRESDRGFGGYQNDPYESRLERVQPRDPVYKRSNFVFAERDDAHSSSPSLISGGGPYMSGARQDRTTTIAAAKSQTDFRGPSRSATQVYDRDTESAAVAPYGPPRGISRQSTRRDEDDFTFIEKRTTRDRAPSIHENFRDPFKDSPVREPQTPRGRARASTFNDDYVMVSPPRDGAATGFSERQSVATDRTTAKSAIYRKDAYSPEERLRRRRSRSINFRDCDTEGHHCGDKFHERPGAEAAMMGKHLAHYDFDDEQDRMDYSYSSRNGSRRDVQRYEDKRDYEDVRYAPQKLRSRSRGGGRRRDEDDDSYVDTYREKKTTTYR